MNIQADFNETYLPHYPFYIFHVYQFLTNTLSHFEGIYQSRGYFRLVLILAICESIRLDFEISAYKYNFVQSNFFNFYSEKM